MKLRKYRNLLFDSGDLLKWVEKMMPNVGWEAVVNVEGVGVVRCWLEEVLSRLFIFLNCALV